MKHLMNLFLVVIVGIFVAGGASVDCSGDKHGEGDKKHSDGH